MGISLVDTKNVETAYEYLVHQFHSRLIQGMDVFIDTIVYILTTPF